MSVNRTLLEDKMLTFKGECAQLNFNKCLIYTHDRASAKFSTNSHEMDNSVVFVLFSKPYFCTVKRGGGHYALYSFLYPLEIFILNFLVRRSVLQLFCQCRLSAIMDICIREVQWHLQACYQLSVTDLFSLVIFS